MRANYMSNIKYFPNFHQILLETTMNQLIMADYKCYNLKKHYSSQYVQQNYHNSTISPTSQNRQKLIKYCYMKVCNGSKMLFIHKSKY